MRVRFRIGPFTFGKSGVRLSIWNGGTGFSVPLFNRRKNRSFSKLKFGLFSFYFGGKKKIKIEDKKYLPEHIKEVRKTHKQAYKPWTIEADKKLVLLFRQGKTVKELSEVSGRTNGAIRSRLNKLLMQ